MTLRKFPLLIGLLIFLASIVPYSASAQDANSSSASNAELTAQLTNIATAALHAQLNVLTDAIGASNDNQTLAVYYQAALQQKLAEAQTQRTALVAHGIVYGEYKLQLTVADAQIDENSAVLHASEYTTIALDNAKTDPLAPQATEYIDEHTFRFQRVDEAWYLTEDQVKMPPNAEVDPQLGPAAGPSSAVESNIDLKLAVYMPLIVGTSDGDNVQASSNQEILVDLKATASYARKWWNSANPTYRNWLPNNDCTDFVSQALRAGGWAYTTR